MDSNYDAVIHVDGSYNDKTKAYAYGVVIADKSGTKYYKEAFGQDDKSSMRNVAGELAGATAAMQYALDNKYKNIQLVYDYKGIEDWCTGAWKTNKDATKAYKQFYDNVAKTVNIDFAHVKGHTGEEGNELCDSLAKSALGLPDAKAKDERYKAIIENAKPCINFADYYSLSEEEKSNVIRSAVEKMERKDFMSMDKPERALIRIVKNQQAELKERCKSDSGKITITNDERSHFSEYLNFRDYRSYYKAFSGNEINRRYDDAINQMSDNQGVQPNANAEYC